VEIVRFADRTVLNIHRNGLVASSHTFTWGEITMPEALVWLAAQIRMGDI
jgi:hypothetical protein